jgi:hypothetical protein
MVTFHQLTNFSTTGSAMKSLVPSYAEVTEQCEGGIGNRERDMLWGEVPRV